MLRPESDNVMGWFKRPIGAPVSPAPLRGVDAHLIEAEADQLKARFAEISKGFEFSTAAPHSRKEPGRAGVDAHLIDAEAGQLKARFAEISKGFESSTAASHSRKEPGRAGPVLTLLTGVLVGVIVSTSYYNPNSLRELKLSAEQYVAKFDLQSQWNELRVFVQRQLDRI